MQRLTLRGYLSDYVRQLSGVNTGSIRALAKAAQKNHRLREPLLLYAYSINKADFLVEVTKDTELGEKYADVRNKFNNSKLIKALEKKSSLLDERYHKCYNSYICRRDMPKTYSRKKKLMHSKVKELQKIKSVTAYRMSKELGLNESNIYSFIKHGDVNKVSVDVARKMLDYLENV